MQKLSLLFEAMVVMFMIRSEIKRFTLGYKESSFDEQ